MMKSIELTNVSKSFGNKKVLNEFNLSIEPGKFYGITGPSGCGKSTLLNILGGIEKPTSGEVKIFNHMNINRNGVKLKKLLRYKISFLFQNYALSDNDTVEYNLKMAVVYNKEIKNKQVAIATALEKVGLVGYEKNKVHQLSGGEQQRVAMARLLLKPTEIIFADEPTGNLDVENREVVFNLLKDLNKMGKTVILVTHDPDLVARCDEIIRL